MLTLAFTIVFVGSPYTSIASAQEYVPSEVTEVSRDSAVETEPRIIALGIPVAIELGKWLTALAVAAIVVNEIAAVKDIYDTLNANRDKTDRKYYIVYYDTSNNWELKTKKALTTAEAITYVKTSTEANVWTANIVDAQALARAASSNGKITSAERHNQNGANTRLYYYHIHDEPRKNGHVFYGKNGVLGALKPYSLDAQNELEVAN